MKALRLDGNLRFVVDEPTPRREGEALVEVICAGICNTDLEIVKGYAGFRGIPGHEFVGRVMESPSAEQIGKRVVGEINAGCGDCDLCRAGDARHCPARTVLGIKERHGAFAEYLSLPARNLVEVPDSVSNEMAVFVEPLAAAFNIIEQVNITPSSEVAVIGDGKLAQLIARVMAATGCRLSIFGRHEEKLELAAGLGANRFRVDPDGEKIAASDGSTPGSGLSRSFDLVIEASGSASGLPLALNMVKPRGIVVQKSTHHNPTLLDMSQVVVNEVTIIGSRCGRFRPAVELLASGTLDLRPLISAELPLEDGLAAFKLAAAPETMKVILRVS
ncbi:MAG TPA: alcohol dehydrogenase catalytic domain-containing protein [Blastocatellia bacterium]|jgi:threonine dehydrogenase-like Zn-dependent dehydrogenase|nr:alcohol dehydrogenase catalytic domain-containing protein [Blastocatellia bacterium]